MCEIHLEILKFDVALTLCNWGLIIQNEKERSSGSGDKGNRKFQFT